MRPLKGSRLNFRVEKKSILMLDITRLSIDYIERLVPGNISSKQGKTQLPLELWDIILDFAAEDDNSHIYALVQPRSLEQSKTGSTTLLCAEIPKWNACGALDVEHFWNYEFYLVDPYGGPNDGRDRPFVLPDDKATLFRVPTEALDKKILFERLTVPDVISWVEGGKCYLCGGGLRVICAGCRYGREIAEEWTSLSHTHIGDCGIMMLCPLCIGRDYAEDSVQMQGELQDDRAEMTYEEYDTWVDERFKELGYM